MPRVVKEDNFVVGIFRIYSAPFSFANEHFPEYSFLFFFSLFVVVVVVVVVVVAVVVVVVVVSSAAKNKKV